MPMHMLSNMFRCTPRAVFASRPRRSAAAVRLALLGLLAVLLPWGPAAADAGLSSDDFNLACGVLGAEWTVVDARNDTTVDIVGVGTSDAQLLISMPPGVEHDTWASGAFSPRVVQAATDSDFEVEVKFDSLPSEDIEGQGVIVEGAGGELLRFDAYTRKGKLRVFSGLVDGASTTTFLSSTTIGSVSGSLYLRVGRVGDAWTFLYSADGASWTTAISYTQALQVSGVGFHALTSGGAPAHDVAVDYFFDTSAPIVPEDGALAGGSGTRTLDVTTAGSGTGSVVRNPDQPDYSCGTSVALTAMPDPGMTFAGWTGDVVSTENSLTVTLSDDYTLVATFEANVDPPVLSNVQTVATENGVTFTWTTDYPSTSGVALGPTSAYELGTISDPAETLSHSITWSGLDPESTYHYEMRSVGAATGLPASSGDATVTTAASPPPARTPFSDDFNVACGALGAGWTTVDPIGGATFDVIGSGTADARLAISVPSGAERNAWVDGLDVPRIVQPIDDVDFTVETRFESPLLSFAQGQGIVVEDAGGDFLRFDFYSDGGAVRFFAAYVLAGSPTTVADEVIPPGSDTYLRLARNAGVWTAEYSADGVAWTLGASFSLPFTPARIGPFALTAGDNPGHTALIDYFFETDSPISPEDGVVSGDPNPAVLTLNATAGGAASADPDLAQYTCGQTVTLLATPAPGFRFDGWRGSLASQDNPLLVALDGDLTLTASFSIDAPAVISNVVVTPGTDSATVTWTTDVPTTSLVEYGETPFYEGGATSNATPTVNHSAVILGLTEDTFHHLLVTVTSATGVESDSGPLGFTTLSAGFDPSGVVSDDFNAPCGTLAAQWRVVDPLDDTIVTLTGGATSDARLVIDLPPGVEHDLDVGALTAPRVLQPISDTDFEVEVKFDSSLELGTQAHGIMVQESFGEFIRFDLYHNGKKVKVYAGVYSGGSLASQLNTRVSLTAPYYMRVTRSGDSWTQWVSDDGTTWSAVTTFSHVMTPTEVGVHALNSGSNPAYVAEIDYFFSTASPIVPEDAGSAGGGDKTLDVTLVGSGGVTRDPDEPTYACGDLVTLTATPDPGSEFTGWTGDVTSGENPLVVTLNADLLLEAGFAPDTDPPILSGLSALARSDSARILWTTNEFATSEVVYGTTPALDAGSVSLGGTRLGHDIELTGLTAATTYYYQAISVDENGRLASSPVAQFTTSAAISEPGIASDDFARANLETGLWTIVDPAGDLELAIVGPDTNDARLQLNVPGGADHAVTAIGPSAPRVMQPVSDADFRIESKLEGDLVAESTGSGIWVQGGPGRFLTFERRTAGTQDALTATTYEAGVATVVVDEFVLPGATAWLEVERIGDAWVFSYSLDGSAWNVAGFFAHAIAVEAVGLFASTASMGGGAPAFSAEFDYFFDAGAPISPEDDGAGTDTLPPLIHAIGAIPAADGFQIDWASDEAATSEVVYGLTEAYELGSVSSLALVQDHALLVSGLVPGKTYFFAVRSVDALAKTSEVSGLSVTTLPPSSGPAIDVWYGNFQRFGHNGLPQPWVNILGNVSDPDGVATLSYALNGGAARTLSLGPDDRRLADPGDFNADIDVNDLLPGANTVVVTATDGAGDVSNEIVTVDFDPTTVATLPFTIDWSTLSEIQDAAQPVDGLWEIEGDTVRAQQLDYDRLLAIGDVGWTDYEMTVPITIHAFDPGGFQAPSNQPGVGMLLRWPGHSIRNDRQPADGFVPLGAIGLVIWKQNGRQRLEVYANSGTNSTRVNVPFDVPFVFKMRVENVPGQGPLYSMKVWEQGTPEPGAWAITQQEGPDDPPAGSAVLVAHHVDASFGMVTITPLP